MAYEPAINTTVSTQEKTRYWLERAVEAAQREGLMLIGFIVSGTDDDTVFEPFSSSQGLGLNEFVELVALASRQMLTDWINDKPDN